MWITISVIKLDST